MVSAAEGTVGVQKMKEARMAGGGGGGGGGYRDFGLLVLRIGIGLAFVVIHGWPHVWGGQAAWRNLGTAVAPLFGKVSFDPVVMGAIGAFIEFVGGMLVIFGLFFRPTCAVMGIFMIIAACTHLVLGLGIKPPDTTMARLAAGSHAMEMAVLFISLVFIGGGKYSLGRHVPSPTIRMETESE